MEYFNMVKYEELNFGITKSSFEVKGGLKSKNLVAVHNKNSILGVREKDGYSAFVIGHGEAYELGEYLFSLLYGEGEFTLGYLNENSCRSVIFIGELTHKNSGVPINILYPDSMKEELEGYYSWRRVFDKFGFRPSIGITNGFGYNDSFEISLLLELSNDTQYQRHILTLSKYKFDEDSCLELAEIENREDRMSRAKEILEEEAFSKFDQELNDFATAYETLQNYPVHEKNTLTALYIDIDDKNLSKAALGADGRKRAELVSVRENADKYFYHKNTLAAIIDFIINTHKIIFRKGVQIKSSRLNQVLRTKRSIGRINRRLLKAKGKKVNELYQKNQLDYFNEIEPELKT